MSGAKYLIAHSSNLDNALKAAKSADLPESNVWCIDHDPRGRAKNWKDVIVDASHEANPIKLTIEESKNTLSYLCFSSGTTGNAFYTTFWIHR